MAGITLRGKVVETVTPRKKKVTRWFYIDIRKALDPVGDREEAIVGSRKTRLSVPISAAKRCSTCQRQRRNMRHGCSR
jgi:hypothetical protein